ncbi:MAG: hypothetical protein A2X46_10530 [Lentisphaerae bacterium GWF2_57_35]|nr:MAG: hypothetical protein A2X46_10530 [Lentisphaerae bacterium GWF2_57_35]
MILKGFTLADAEDVFAYASNPNVLRQTTACPPQSPSETEEFVRTLIDSPPGSFAWAIRVKSAPRVVGAIEFDLGDGHIGSTHYALAEEYWNKGLMTEACRAILAWAFDEHHNLEAVKTDAMNVNMGSRRVLEKAGFECQGTREDRWAKFHESVQLAVYEITRKKWESSQPAGGAYFLPGAGKKSAHP